MILERRVRSSEYIQRNVIKVQYIFTITDLIAGPFNNVQTKVKMKIYEKRKKKSRMEEK